MLGVLILDRYLKNMRVQLSVPPLVLKEPVGWIKLVCLVTYIQDPLDNLRPSDRSIYGFMVPRPLFFW